MISPDFTLLLLFSCSYASFGICEAIFRVRDLSFSVGAHNSIYFVNIQFSPSPTSTLTTPQKVKKGKIRKLDHFEAFLWGG